jgi:hypothetical protein
MPSLNPIRRQAQEFLQVPFVERHSRVFEYAMSPDEQALYTDVTAWLTRENLCAFRGNQRHLLLIRFHRRMASSLAAFPVASSAWQNDCGIGWPARGYTVSDDGTQLLRELAADLEVVERFATRARELGHDSKARRLLDALHIVQERGAQGAGSGNWPGRRRGRYRRRRARPIARRTDQVRRFSRR